MCGILGHIADPGQSYPSNGLRYQEAIATLAHRGPDSRGEYSDGAVWLAHTRLSILDPSRAGSQPMHSGDGRFVVTYNGEVYNFRELASTHALSDLRSRSDTEVVLRLFARHGVRSLTELNGIFAFAVYDRDARRMWLVRDRLGVKPLYYELDRSGLTFASEMKAILALRPHSRQCNWEALHEWLYYGNTLADRTLYRGIKQLLPGHYLEIDVASMECEERQYWSLQRVAERSCYPKKPGDAIEETRRLLEQAVKRQLVSDVPVGIFLSGGVDSSAIAAFASRHYEGKLATYSVGFDFSKDGGELPKARRIAEYYSTEHHELYITGPAVADLVEEMVRCHDSPFSDAANIPLYLMASQIRGETKVVLQGDGGDELFGGYRRYVTFSYYKLLHHLAAVLRYAAAAVPRSALRYRMLRYLRAFGAQHPAETVALLLTTEDRHSEPEAILSPAVASRLRRTDPFARFSELYRLFAEHDRRNQMSLMDISIVLADVYLEKVDRATMAASLEVRVPFLDYDLVDYAVSLPGSVKMPRGKRKWLLKAALRGVVPDDILDGPKRGFSVPYGEWLQSSLKPLFFDNLQEFSKRQPHVLNCERIELLFSRTSSGRQNHSFLLWKMLNFLVWANHANVDFNETPIS